MDADVRMALGILQDRIEALEDDVRRLTESEAAPRTNATEPTPTEDP